MKQGNVKEKADCSMKSISPKYEKTKLHKKSKEAAD
jgi:hypothetical protein